MPAGYEPRTEHLAPDGRPLFLNRLVLETSPYLRQHAHNPVDWFPWGQEAFERAKAEDKPVFLSIGYSTCHWCHVMERESFDNVEVARLMNELFVCIKVDREQRPDVDDIYMTAVQVTQQRGGWPMSSFLLPDRRPFFGATYFPPQQFVNLMRQVDTAWRERRADLEASAAQITDLVRQITAARGAAKNLGRPVIGQAVQGLVASTDRDPRRLRRRSEVPQRNEPPAAARGGASHRRQGTDGGRADHAARDGPRRHPRPGRRRLPPLLRWTAGGSFPTSRRCSTTRPTCSAPTPWPTG